MSPLGGTLAVQVDKGDWKDILQKDDQAQSLSHHKSMNINFERINRKDMSALLKQTSFIPRDFHQPEKIYAIFSDRCSTEDPATLRVLTGLFFGIGSPSAFNQLSTICTVLRQSPVLPTPQAASSLRQMVQALDGLNAHGSVIAVLRRYFLVSLKAHRLKLEEEHQHSPPMRTRKALRRTTAHPEAEALQGMETYDRADIEALRKMMEEAYPDLPVTRSVRGGIKDEYQRKLSALKERIRSGRNWKALQETFGPSILLLIPPRDEYKISDSE